jgi:putative heme-binding domain-containing protein
MRYVAATFAVLLATTPVCAQNPFRGNEQAIAEGHVIYNRSCTTCHGHDGAAGDRAPALAATRRYMRNSDQELFDAVRNGIPDTQMPASGLSETDAWKVAVYIRSLRATAIDTPAKGDTAHGEQIFWGKGGCGSCHVVDGKGALMGPDLSHVASQRKLSAIREALTKTKPLPSPGYQRVRIVTGAGETISGILKNEHNFSLQVLGSDNTLHVFVRDELREVTYEPDPLMPGDYDQRLTPNEFEDLLAFLSRLGSRQTRPAPRARGDLAQ